MKTGDDYTLLHRMLESAKTKEELSIVRKRYRELIDANENSTDRDDRFDLGWGLSCLAGIENQLGELEMAEYYYKKSVKVFDENKMPMNAATICKTLALLFVDQERLEEAEQQLKENVRYLIDQWGEDSRHVLKGQKELQDFQVMLETNSSISSQGLRQQWGM